MQAPMYEMAAQVLRLGCWQSLRAVHRGALNIL